MPPVSASSVKYKGDLREWYAIGTFKTLERTSGKSALMLSRTTCKLSASPLRVMLSGAFSHATTTDGRRYFSAVSLLIVTAAMAPLCGYRLAT